jgi:hypothetical protein
VFPINSGHETFPHFQKSTGKTYLFIGDEETSRAGRAWEGSNYLGSLASGPLHRFQLGLVGGEAGAEDTRGAVATKRCTVVLRGEAALLRAAAKR